MPSNTDIHFAEQAIKLAHNAARALEEARSYANDINDKTLKEKTEEEIDKIIEEL